MSLLEIIKKRPENLLTLMYKELSPKELFRVDKYIYMALDELREYDSRRLSVCLMTGEFECFEPDKIVVCVYGEFTYRDEEK